MKRDIDVTLLTEIFSKYFPDREAQDYIDYAVAAMN